MLKKLVVFALSSGLAVKIYRAYAEKVRASASASASAGRSDTVTPVEPSSRNRL